MRHVSSIRALLFMAAVGGAASAQAMSAYDVISKFTEAVAADNYSAAKDLLVKQQPILRYAWFDGENQYFSAVANKSDVDVKTRGNVLSMFAKLALSDLKDGWYLERWTWDQKADAALAAKMVKIFEVFDRADREFSKATSEGTGDLYLAAIKSFTELDALASAVPDHTYVCYANWYAGVCEKSLMHSFEAIYRFKKSMEAGREAKLHLLIDREANLPGELRTLAEKSKIDPAKVDLRLSMADAKAKLEAAATDSKPAGGPDSRPDGSKGGDPAKPDKGGKPAAGGAKGKDGVPPKANEHGGKVDWIDAPAPKVKEVGEKGFLSSYYFSNNPPLRWQRFLVAPGADMRLEIVPGENKLVNDKGKLMFDADGGGKGEPEKLKLGGKPESVKFAKRNFGDKIIGDVWFRMMEQPTTYKLMGFEMKDNPEKTGTNVLFSCGMAATTKFMGYDVTVYDDNADGKFDTYEHDCLVVSKGSERHVAPLSGIAYIGDLLYHVKIDPAGKSMKFKPYDGPVALLKVEYGTGPGPAFLVARGSTEELAGTAFNLMDARDKWMWVPVGSYQIAHGYFAFGEGDKRETITVSQGRSGVFLAKEDKENVWKLGGADTGFKFLWQASKKDDVLTLKGKDIKVFGAGNEQYEWFLPGVFRPTVRAKMGEKGAQFYEKEMARIDDSANRMDGDAKFFPKDVEIKLPGKGDVFLQLEETYPKLGKISSPFTMVQ
jgi:hypothetical protein